MKINFRYADGTRSSMTLNDKLLDVWGLTLENDNRNFEQELTDRIIPEALKGERDPKTTLVSIVEFLLLDDIAQAIQFDMVPKE